MRFRSIGNRMHIQSKQSSYLSLSTTILVGKVNSKHLKGRELGLNKFQWDTFQNQIMLLFLLRKSSLQDKDPTK